MRFPMGPSQCQVRAARKSALRVVPGDQQQRGRVPHPHEQGHHLGAVRLVSPQAQRFGDKPRCTKRQETGNYAVVKIAGDEGNFHAEKYGHEELGAHRADAHRGGGPA